MFSFIKFNVYKKARAFNLNIRKYLAKSKIDYPTQDQLRRASLSVQLNVAEGSGRFTDKDRRRFFIMSRSSIFECMSILDTLKEEGSIRENQFDSFANDADELSRIIYKMIKNLSD